MDASAGSREFNLEEVVNRVKEDENGPAARTLKVYNYLADSGQFTNWDLVCFCGEYLGSLVGSLPWLTEPVKHLLRLIYMAHYVRFETIQWLDKKTSAGRTETKTENGGPVTPGQ